ncbi:hypothetical protein NHP190009_08670 [Helicobacter ailurogastricus]|nr:hypothetical protein NHP190009_08670 [Helicobacter ailurogastricus]
MSHYNKAEVALNLFHTLRNRCYHWGNITKTRQTKEGRPYPRITTKILNIPMGIHPNKIENFLNDLTASFSEELLEYANHLLDKRLAGEGPTN